MFPDLLFDPTHLVISAKQLLHLRKSILETSTTYKDIQGGPLQL